MEPTISSALSLLVVGMITVFVVLALVVLVGKVLIRLVNTLATEEPIKTTSHVIDPKKLAAISATVEIVTAGKGKITKVERVK